MGSWGWGKIQCFLKWESAGDTVAILVGEGSPSSSQQGFLPQCWGSLLSQTESQAGSFSRR